VNTGNLGGTLNLVPGMAAKNHLIYRCAGAACALPTNAGNYALVGVAIGNDGYFSDYGAPVSPATIDLGDAPATAPTTSTNDWLSTTIANGGGTTTLTLAGSAATTVSGARVFHDNVPNLLAVCASTPNNGAGTGFNGMHIVIPAPTVYSHSTNDFPINSNFQMGPPNTLPGTPAHCPAHTTIELKGQLWLGGAILPGHTHNFVGEQGGSSNPMPAFYDMGKALNGITGNSYPMFYFDPESSSNNYLENLLVYPNQSYQVGLYYDQELSGDGVVSQRYENVHVNGAPDSFPIVDKTGFGRFWNYGGWASKQPITFTQNCGSPGYQRLPVQGTGIVQTNGTYSFGTAVVDMCGMAVASFGHFEAKEMLTEGNAGPAWYFNTKPYGLSGVSFISPTYADFTGGFATPFYDLTNSGGGVRFKDASCANGYQALMETGTTAASYTGIQIQYAPTGAGCSFTGVQNYRLDSDGLNLATESNYNRQLLGSSEIYTPMAAASPVTGLTQGGAGNVPVGTYTYCLTASDPFGGETAIATSSCATVNVTGVPSIVNFTLPSSFPAGATGVNLYINGILSAPYCTKPQYTQAGSPQSYNLGFYCGNSPPQATTAAANGLNGTALSATKLWLSSEYVSAAPRAEQNIFLDSIELDAGQSHHGDKAAGPGEDGARRVHDECGGAIDGRNHGGEFDDRRRGE
jgi:hypothetical protein